MFKEVCIVGTSSNEEIQLVQQDISRRTELSNLPFENEQPKTKQQLRLIGLVDQYIHEELAALNITQETHLIPEAIHYFPTHVYIDLFPDMEGTDGFTNLVTRTSYIDRESYSSMLALFKVTLFQALQVFSYRSYYWDAIHNEAQCYRSGYWNVGHPTKEGAEHLKGFQDAVTELMTRQLFRKHANAVIEELRIPKQEQLFVTSFEDQVDLLETIIEGVAEYSKEPPEDVWARIKKGYFTGAMMHFRSVEQAFGKGSVRVLGALDSADSDLEREALVDNYFEFFATTDPEEQRAIARLILSTREWEAYDYFTRSR